MELLQIQNIKTEITSKITVGDYITLGKIIGEAQATARMRYKRDNEQAVLGMRKIIESREELIESFK